jgi:non-ribosomal peptide synthetase-like protein
MKVGSHVEVSTAFNFVPDLVELKDGSFVADHVSLGGGVFNNGRFSLTKTIIGQRTFLGNNCVTQAQSFLGDNALIGVLSITPDIVDSESSWLGSPPFRLPARATSSQVHSSSRTFSPPWYLYVSRLIWEFFKLFSPSFFRLYSMFGFWMLVAKVSYPLFQEGTPLFWLSAAFWELGIVLCILLLIIALKWILIGRFCPGESPLWSSYVWRAELVASLEESVAMPFGVSSTLGTPLISWWFRAMGATIGSRVYLASIYLTEADLIEIGDDSCIGAGSTIQSHLFEDRVMKMDKLIIGNECTVCSDAIVLYGAKLEDRCTLMPLSLCMKSEHLKHTAVYCGIPAREVAAELHRGYHIDWQLTTKMQEEYVTDGKAEVELIGYKKLDQ